MGHWLGIVGDFVMCLWGNSRVKEIETLQKGSWECVEVECSERFDGAFMCNSETRW